MTEAALFDRRSARRIRQRLPASGTLALDLKPAAELKCKMKPR